jgi:hypothetical protein
MHLNMENCWDCPISFETALGMFLVALVCVSAGIWLRRLKKPFGRIIGNILLALAALEIFALNHAGRNWGIIRIDDPRYVYDRNIVSLLLLLFVILVAASVRHFRKSHAKC